MTYSLVSAREIRLLLLLAATVVALALRHRERPYLEPALVSPGSLVILSARDGIALPRVEQAGAREDPAGTPIVTVDQRGQVRLGDWHLGSASEADVADRLAALLKRGCQKPERTLEGLLRPWSSGPPPERQARGDRGAVRLVVDARASAAALAEVLAVTGGTDCAGAAIAVERAGAPATLHVGPSNLGPWETPQGDLEDGFAPPIVVTLVADGAHVEVIGDPVGEGCRVEGDGVILPAGAGEGGFGRCVGSLRTRLARAGYSPHARLVAPQEADAQTVLVALAALASSGDGRVYDVTLLPIKIPARAPPRGATRLVIESELAPLLAGARTRLDACREAGGQRRPRLLGKVRIARGDAGELLLRTHGLSLPVGECVCDVLASVPELRASRVAGTVRFEPALP